MEGIPVGIAPEVGVTKWPVAPESKMAVGVKRFMASVTSRAKPPVVLLRLRWRAWNKPVWVGGDFGFGSTGSGLLGVALVGIAVGAATGWVIGIAGFCPVTVSFSEVTVTVI